MITFKNKDQDDPENLNTKLQEYVLELKETYQSATFKSSLLEEEDEETELNNFMIKEEADMLAMVPSTNSFLDNLLDNRVTNNSTFQSTTPILAIPAKAKKIHFF
ncbi:MAG: hypothetical protein ABIN48_10320 [Ginsengibacter sp.]